MLLGDRDPRPPKLGDLAPDCAVIGSGLGKLPDPVCRVALAEKLTGRFLDVLLGV